MIKKLLGRLTCSKCGHKQKMEIPSDKCSLNEFLAVLAFVEMHAGKCIFCSYSDKKCPSGCL